MGLGLDPGSALAATASGSGSVARVAASAPESSAGPSPRSPRREPGAPSGGEPSQGARGEGETATEGRGGEAQSPGAARGDGVAGSADVAASGGETDGADEPAPTLASVGGANLVSAGAGSLQLATRGTPALRFTPHGQYWVRGQGRFNSDFDPAAGDRESAVLQRVRFGILAESGPLRAYIELQDARQWGFEESTIADQANVDLHQGFLEVGGERGDRAGYVRVGRQEIEVGSRRLFVDANWHPLGQSFDAVRAAGRVGRFAADAGFIVLDPARTFSAADPSGGEGETVDVRSRGTYSGYLQLATTLGERMTLEGLLLGISERPSPSAPTSERDILNAGLRLHGAPLAGLSYDVEAYGQAGRSLGLRHRAWASFSTLDYTFVGATLRPGLALRYNYASGQACATGPEEGCGNQQSGEFYRFFGLGHARYGIADRAGHSNLRDLEVAAHLRPHRSVRLELAYHFLQLDEATGRWRQANGGLVGAGWDPSNTSRDLAHEVDLLVTLRSRKQPFVQPGYGLFVPLAGGRRIAGSAPQHFAFLWMIAKF